MLWTTMTTRILLIILIQRSPIRLCWAHLTSLLSLNGSLQHHLWRFLNQTHPLSELSLICHTQRNQMWIYIHKNALFGQPHTHDLPMVQKMFSFNCLIGVIDIQRAYRKVPSCPMDLPLLSIRYNGKYYVDSAMPFGARLSSMNMQKIAHFIVRALRSIGVIGFMFLDD